MARLNEPAVPPESLEAMKRRYLRQNRDLAKTNSIQSIRIRALESEVSRLLTENLELREEILLLRNESEGPCAPRELGGLKERLEDKLQEIGSLIAELGDLRPAPRKMRRATQRPQKCEQEILEDQERRLPAISENKAWSQIQGPMVEFKESPASAADSFELEPPPVAQFCDDESPTSVPVVEDQGQEQGLPESLSVNLETRKKRRESVQPKRVMVFDDSPNSAQPEVVSMRVGAKRKLSLRDDVISPVESQASQSRGDVEEPKKTQEKEIVRLVDSKALGKSERRAFGEKPINTDPIVSPKKTKKSTDFEVPQKPALSSFLTPSQEAAIIRIKERKAARDDRDRKITKFNLPKEDISQLSSINLEHDNAPKTPGLIPSDFLSPLASQPSTGRAASKDTPPPNALSTSNMAEVPGGGRAGRRARAVVNYAEPNLISKMRRPTKELVNAVGKDGRPLVGAMVVKGENDRLSQDWRPVSTTSTDDLVIKDDVPSPLGKKRPAESKPSLEAVDSTAESALRRSESRKRSQSIMNGTTQADKALQGEAGKNWSQDLSIFEFTSSSPNEKDAKTQGISRRRSTMLDGRGEKVATTTEVIRTSRPSLRRKSMMV